MAHHHYHWDMAAKTSRAISYVIGCEEGNVELRVHIDSDLRPSSLYISISDPVELRDCTTIHFPGSYLYDGITTDLKSIFDQLEEEYIKLVDESNA